jgi:hypothetical protein
VSDFFGLNARELTPAETAMREESDEVSNRYWTRVLSAAAAGAFSAGTAAAIAGGDRETIILAAAVGGVAAGIAGHYVSQSLDKYAQEGEALDVMIADVRTENESAQRIVVSMGTVLEEERAKLESMRTAAAQGEVEERALETELRQAKKNAEDANEALLTTQAQLTTFEDAGIAYKAARPDENTAQYQEEVTLLREHVESMTSLVEQLGALEQQ